MALPFDPLVLTRADLPGVGIGVTSEVARIKGTNIVTKLPGLPPMFGPVVHEIERTVYGRLGEHPQHPNILKCLSQSPPECKLLRNGLLFEYHSRGTLVGCIAEWDVMVPRLCRTNWPYQAASASAIAHIHSLNIIHADLGLHNFLLHDDGRIVLCDFAGLSVDGQNSHVAAGVRYANPLFTWGYPNRKDDVFSLGSVLYELHCGERLFADLSDAEIHARLRERRFPDLDGRCIPQPLRGVIEKCWTEAGDGYSARDALKDFSSGDV